MFIYCFWLFGGLLFPFTDYFLKYISSKQTFQFFFRLLLWGMLLKQRKETVRLSFAALCCPVASSKASDLLFSAQVLWCLGRSADKEGTVAGNILYLTTFLSNKQNSKGFRNYSLVSWIKCWWYQLFLSVFISLLFPKHTQKSFMVFLLAGELFVSRLRQVVWMGNQIWGYSLSFLTFCKEKSPFG